jgi:outer membrane murein-binding lipoprotein Lpp
MNLSFASAAGIRPEGPSVDAKEFVALAKELWPILAAAGAGVVSFAGAILTWLKWRLDVRKQRADQVAALAQQSAELVRLRQDAQAAREKQKIDLFQIAQEVAQELVQDLRAEVQRLRSEVAALEAEMLALRKDHAESIAAKDAELAVLRGELRAKDAMLAAYERYVTKNGLEPLHPSEPFYRVPSGSGPSDLEPMG